MKADISVLKTREGLTRYFIKYENEIFMLFIIDGYIDTLGISINIDKNKDTKIIIMQKDRNLGFKLVSGLNELESDL